MTILPVNLVVEDQGNLSKGEYPGPKLNFMTMEEEYSYWVDDIEGDIPSDLHGTFFRNGPARFQIGGEKISHWWDGDGMIVAVTFRDGRVQFKNKFIRTPKYLEKKQQSKKFVTAA